MEKYSENITVDNIDEILSQGKVYLQFSANWCGPCKVLSKTVQNLLISGDFDHTGLGVEFYKINIDNNRELAMKFGVRSIPHVMLYQNGELVTQFVGGKNPVELKSLLETTFS